MHAWLASNPAELPPFFREAYYLALSAESLSRRVEARAKIDPTKAPIMQVAVDPVTAKSVASTLWTDIYNHLWRTGKLEE